MSFELFGVLGFLGIVGVLTYRHVSKNDYVSIKAFKYYSKVVTSYRWEYRKRIPYSFRKVTDRVMNVDPFDATVNCPGDTSESIKILKAIMSRPDMRVDVTEEMSKFMHSIEEGWGVVKHIRARYTPKVY